MIQALAARRIAGHRASILMPLPTDQTANPPGDMLASLTILCGLLSGPLAIGAFFASHAVADNDAVAFSCFTIVLSAMVIGCILLRSRMPPSAPSRIRMLATVGVMGPLIWGFLIVSFALFVIGGPRP